MNLHKIFQEEKKEGLMKKWLKGTCQSKPESNSSLKIPSVSEFKGQWIDYRLETLHSTST